MNKTVLLAAAAAFALTAGGAVAATSSTAVGVRAPANQIFHHAKKAKTLYDQNTADGLYGFFSQTLSSYPQYDEYLADDFTVPKGATWTVSEVDVTGFYYIEYGPASSVNVLFWKDKNGLPSAKKGKAAITCDNITPTGGLSTGAFEIALPKSCKAQLAGGKKGTTYWVTVQANMTGELTSGYWAWNTNTAIKGNEAAGYWYGGSVTTNDPRCNTQFESMTDCTGQSVDFAFALLGSSKK